MVDVAHVVPDALLDIRYATADNLTGAPLPGYGRPAAWLDDALADRLADGARRLRDEGFRLIVYDAYRPRRAALALGAWARDTGQAWLLDGYISEASRHSKGTAIDVGLIRVDGAAVDLGTGFDDFGAQAHTRNAVGMALEHRLLLRRCMMASGFEDYRREWWHFDVPALERPLRDTPYPQASAP
jgi:D-alanyl-D-alanine dipeptidase